MRLVEGSEDIAAFKRDAVPAFKGLTFWWGRGRGSKREIDHA